MDRKMLFHICQMIEFLMAKATFVLDIHMMHLSKWNGMELIFGIHIDADFVNLHIEDDCLRRLDAQTFRCNACSGIHF